MNSKTIYFTDCPSCRRRKIDQLRIMNYLTENGHSISENADTCDYVIINTCGVTQETVTAAITNITQLQNNGVPILVVGCVVKTDPDELDMWDVVPLADLNQLDSYFLNTIPFEDIPLPVQGPSDDTVCYLSIARGCTEHCTYCATRKAVGNIASVPIPHITKNLEHVLQDHPIKRIVLDGDCVGAYGLDLGVTLSDLLQSFPRLPKLSLQIDMLHPHYFNINFATISEIAQRNELGFLVVPFQSTTSSTLHRMGRRGDIGQCLNNLAQIKRQSPNTLIGTDLIIGFPGESDADFLNDIDTLNTSAVDWCHLFMYSMRNNTASAQMQQLSTENKMKRIETAARIMKKNGWFVSKEGSALTCCRRALVTTKNDNPYRANLVEQILHNIVR